ncbi:hypothetical protein [Variovorax sp. J31P207]|uniref:hypothetical protein n=1 Tax=Variovorax sp. J31P207 TaxID=3053510 RepID=UPI0025787D76|nr:hypothetical protein [Variovorax sp. J31P207]MDM0069937.1 hypothetical protein [Variovorax sp. J31P207]
MTENEAVTPGGLRVALIADQGIEVLPNDAIRVGVVAAKVKEVLASTLCFSLFDTEPSNYQRMVCRRREKGDA